MISFYLSGENWILDDKQIPSGTRTMHIVGNIIRIYTLEDKLLYNTEYSNFTDEVGVPYVSLAAFKAAVLPFFVRASGDGGDLVTDIIKLDTSYSGDTNLGEMSWNSEDYTVNIGSIGGSVLQIGQELYAMAINQTGNTILNGSGVYAYDTLGASGKILVNNYLANNTINSKYFVGLATQDIENGDAKISSNVDIRIYRDITNASGEFAGVDTYAGSVELKYFDIHVPRNSNGSRQQYFK